jgi:hypothetical protein
VDSLPAPLLELAAHLHVVWVHFAVALLPIGALVLLVERRESRAGALLFTLGALGATVAAASGWWSAAYEPLGSSVAEELFLHRYGGVAVAAVAWIAVPAGWAARRGGAFALGLQRLSALTAGLLVLWVGHLGSGIVHGSDAVAEPWNQVLRALRTGESAPAAGQLPAPPAIDPAVAAAPTPPPEPLTLDTDPAAQAALADLRAAGARAERVAEGLDEVEVHFRGRATDAELALLAPLAPYLTDLDLSRSAVTDLGAKHLAGLTRLRSLRLDSTAVGDAGVAALTELRELQVLNLAHTAITPACRAALDSLPALERVYLFGTAADLAPETAPAAPTPP